MSSSWWPTYSCCCCCGIFLNFLSFSTNDNEREFIQRVVIILQSTVRHPTSDKAYSRLSGSRCVHTNAHRRPWSCFWVFAQNLLINIRQIDRYWYYRANGVSAVGNLVYTLSQKTRHYTPVHNFAKVRLSRKFATKSYLNTPSHPKPVATLPCEISMFKKSQFLRSKWSKLLCET